MVYRIEGAVKEWARVHRWARRPRGGASLPVLVYRYSMPESPGPPHRCAGPALHPELRRMHLPRAIRALVAALLLPAATLAAQSTAPPPPPSIRAPARARIDAVFKAYDRPHVPGCALGVFRDGTLAYGRGYGWADLERNVPIT